MRCRRWPGVDHRVERAVVALVHDDRVEGVTGGLHPDSMHDLHRATVVQGDAENERLRDRLNRELAIGVADAVDVAVGGGNGDAELIRVGLGEFGDVGGNSPAVTAVHPAVHPVQTCSHHRTRRGCLLLNETSLPSDCVVICRP
jgi:hypothetical protein